MEETTSDYKALIEKERILFEEERNRYYLEGETKPKNIGEPFFLENKSSKSGILLIHGFMAAPEEVREWGDFLYKKGYSVYAPRLAGHGTSAVDLSNRNYSEWVESVDRGHEILKQCCDNIVVGGFSTGAGLALYQAIFKPDAFDAVISISAPLRFSSFSVNLVESVKIWNKMVNRFGISRLSREFAKNHPDNPHINYHRCPVNGLVEVRALMRKTYRNLSALSIPSLIIQGVSDPKVDGRSGRMISDRIKGPDMYYREIDFHQHGIVRGQITEEIFPEVEKFLNRFIP